MKKTLSIFSLGMLLFSSIAPSFTYASGEIVEEPTDTSIIEDVDENNTEENQNETESDISDEEQGIVTEEQGLTKEETGSGAEEILEETDSLSGLNLENTTSGEISLEATGLFQEEGVNNGLSLAEFSGEDTTAVVDEKTEIEKAWETLNSSPIEGSNKEDNVTVNVYANPNTFPEGTKLVIKPVIDNELQEIKEKIANENKNINEGAKAVAFDITFLYTLSNGEEIEVQPKDGNSVKVTFDYSSNSELKQAEESNTQEIQVYHINDKDEEGNKIEKGEEVVEKIEINEEASEEITNTIVVDAESFSFYTIIVQTPSFNQTWDEITIFDPKNPLSGYTIMDRNLGATSNNINSTDSYGNYYQWGNNYGFNYSLGNSVPTTSNGLTWNDSYNNSGYYSTNFINGGKFDNDVWNGSSHHDGVWGGAKDSASNGWGANLKNYTDRQGPCPEGWHVPSAGEWGLLVKYYHDTHATNVTLEGSNNLFHFRDSTASQNFMNYFKIPFAGYRDSSSIVLDYNNVPLGRYWSSSPYSASSKSAYRLYLYGALVRAHESDNRARGFSVRCFKNSFEPPKSYNLIGDSCAEGYSKDGDKCVKGYTLNFDATTNGGTTTVVSVTGITFDISNLTTYSAEKAGYTFIGWNTGADAHTGLSSITLTENTTVYAIFKKDFPATFNFGTGVKSIPSEGRTCSKFNNETECIANPIEITCSEGYSTGVLMPTENSTEFTASCSPITYTITYELNGGTQSGAKTTYTVEDESFTLVMPEKEYYYFVGWTGSNGDELQTELTILKGSKAENLTYYANYKLRNDANHDNIPDETQTKHNLTILYINDHGDDMFFDYSGEVVEGGEYNVISWTNEYYTVDTPVVSGTMGEEDIIIFVKYTAINDENNNGIADEQEPHHIVKFLPGDHGTLKGVAVYSVVTGLSLGEFSGYSEPVAVPNNGYQFKGWDSIINTGDILTGDVEYTAIWSAIPNQKTSSSGGGRSINNTNNTNNEQEHNSADDNKGKTENKNNESDNNQNNNNGSNESNENNEETDNNNDNQTSDINTDEFKQAFNYAKELGITSKTSIETAELKKDITREELAKMVIVYMDKVLGKKPITNKVPKYPDVTVKYRGQEMYDYIVLAYQYQIMGIEADGSQLKYFNPEGKVTRAEFATVLSRALYGDTYNQKGAQWAAKHIEALRGANILMNTDKNIVESRGNVMLMLSRTKKTLGE